MPSDRTEFWSVPVQRLFADLQSRPEGLSSAEAARRLAVIGPNVAAPKRRAGALRTLAAQYTSPITMLLLGAAILSLVLGEGVDGTIILGILLVSGLLGFWQERRAASAVERLLVLIRSTTRAVRDGQQQDIAVEAVVPGDIVVLAAGAGVPGDARILESNDLFVDQSALTGAASSRASSTSSTGGEAGFAMSCHLNIRSNRSRRRSRDRRFAASRRTMAKNHGGKGRCASNLRAFLSATANASCNNIVRLIAVTHELGGKECGRSNVPANEYADRRAVATGRSREQLRIRTAIILHAQPRYTPPGSRAADYRRGDVASCALFCSENAISPSSHANVPCIVSTACGVAALRTEVARQVLPDTTWVHRNVSPFIARSVTATDWSDRSLCTAIAW